MTTNQTQSSLGTADASKRIKGIISAATGNLVEFYDFYVYAAFSIYFKHAIVPPDYSDAKSQIFVAGVFAASFLMRPLGSWFFGYIGDRFGRKRSMVLSITLMGLGSILFGLLPTYAAVGAIAPYLFILCRMIQGFSVGGEYGSVATYLSEMGLKGRRGLITSLQYCMLVGGQLLALLFAFIAALVLDEKALEDWGWRVAFFIGGGAAFLSLWARLRLEDSVDENTTKHEGSGSMMYMLKNYTRSFLTVVGMTAGGSMMYYVVTIYSRDYFILDLNFKPETANAIMTYGLAVLLIVQPIFGMLADKISAKTNMLLFTFLSICTVYFVYVRLFPSVADSKWLTFLVLAGMMLILSFYTAISALIKAALFPPHVRALGVSFGYALGNAIFGGSAPWLALHFKDWGVGSDFFVLTMIILSISLGCSILLPKNFNYLDNESDASARDQHPYPPKS